MNVYHDIIMIIKLKYKINRTCPSAWSQYLDIQNNFANRTVDPIPLLVWETMFVNLVINHDSS